MSAIKTILVPVGDGTVESPLEAAFRLATTYGGHVTGLYVRADPTSAVPLVGEGMSGAMVEELMSVAERQADARGTDAHALFETIRQRHGIPLAARPPVDGATARWLDIVGREEEVVAERGRLSDVVIMNRPTNDAEVPLLMTMNAALMECGRPLLLTPPVLPDTLGMRVAIAWNSSAEACRAVTASLPLLEQAESVTILTAAEAGHAASQSADLAEFLAWHGIIAEARAIHGGSNAGQALLNEAAAVRADLLVMGAYTHSRLRQLILGGVTRYILGHAQIPCLLSH